jgi:hypothetical protein
MSKFIVNFTIGLHLASAWGCSGLGAYEVYTNRPIRYFSASGDDINTASARGLIHGACYPYNTVSNVPKLLNMQNLVKK